MNTNIFLTTFAIASIPIAIIAIFAVVKKPFILSCFQMLIAIIFVFTISYLIAVQLTSNDETGENEDPAQTPEVSEHILPVDPSSTPISDSISVLESTPVYTPKPAPNPTQEPAPAPTQGSEPWPSQGPEPAPTQGSEPGPSQGPEPAPTQGSEPWPEPTTEHLPEPPEPTFESTPASTPWEPRYLNVYCEYNPSFADFYIDFITPDVHSIYYYPSLDHPISLSDGAGYYTVKIYHSPNELLYEETAYIDEYAEGWDVYIPYIGPTYGVSFARPDDYLGGMRSIPWEPHYGEEVTVTIEPLPDNMSVTFQDEFGNPVFANYVDGKFVFLMPACNVNVIVSDIS